MSGLDILILVMLVPMTIYKIFSSKTATGAFKISIALLTFSFSMPFFWKGFYWQYIPAYLQICLLLVIAYSNAAFLVHQLSHVR